MSSGVFGKAGTLALCYLTLLSVTEMVWDAASCSCNFAGVKSFSWHRRTSYLDKARQGPPRITILIQ